MGSSQRGRRMLQGMGDLMWSLGSASALVCIGLVCVRARSFTEHLFTNGHLPFAEKPGHGEHSRRH